VWGRKLSLDDGGIEKKRLDSADARNEGGPTSRLLTSKAALAGGRGLCLQSNLQCRSGSPWKGNTRRAPHVPPQRRQRRQSRLRRLVGGGGVEVELLGADGRHDGVEDAELLQAEARGRKRGEGRGTR